MCFTSRMSKLCICLLLIACASVAPAMEVNINFLLGEKGLDNDEWGAAALGVEADSQPVFGVRKIWRTGKARRSSAVVLGSSVERSWVCFSAGAGEPTSRDPRQGQAADDPAMPASRPAT